MRQLNQHSVMIDGRIDQAQVQAILPNALHLIGGAQDVPYKMHVGNGAHYVSHQVRV